MDDNFIKCVEMVVYKMIEEGKLFIQKTIDNNGDIYISLNTILKNDEPEDNGEYLTYVANYNGKFGIKIGNIKDIINKEE